jgi:phosphoenolpyruvate---glycerone phosphotransferase subunit DhaL
MGLEPFELRSMIELTAERIRANADELCTLDWAIGDGDHGANMNRGWQAVRAEGEDLVSCPLGEAVGAIGRILVMTVGGASGPLFGSFFLAAGAAIRGGLRVPEDLAAVFAAGVEAVGARGRSTAGEKTMLDVLHPVMEGLRAQDGTEGLTERIRATAREAVLRTAPMLATKGRAAYLGQRSIGHIDPGARSSFLIVEAVCDVLEKRL